MTAALLGLDIGTTSSKAILFDTNGTEIVRENSPAYKNHSPQPGWVEQDPEEVWLAIASTIRSLVQKTPPKTEIIALSIAAQSGSLIPADGNGTPVYPLITWMDGRTQTLVERWRNENKEAQVKSRSGWSLHAGLPLPTIAWLRQHDSQIFNAARHFFSLNDFIAHHLTGKRITNPSNAGGMQLLNLHTGDWDEYLCDLAGISSTRLSQIQPAGSPIGNISAQASSATGLPQSVLLINGGHDQALAALGLGINAPNKFLLACGTAWVISGVRDQLNLDTTPLMPDWNLHPLEGRWIISQSLGGLGASLEWWGNVAWQGLNERVKRADIFAALNAELNGSKPKPGLFFLPITGGYDNPSTSQGGGFVGLHLSHSRADMARAILESAAFELRRAIQKADLASKEIWMVGGAAESRYWTQVLATVTGIPIQLPRYDNWAALGAAVLAGIGTMQFNSIEDALQKFEKPVQTVVPSEALRKYYDEQFEAYQAHRMRLSARV